MATSCVPWNRVADYGAQGRPLPDDIAVDNNGQLTKNQKEAVALKSFGGNEYSYKGAALGGMVEVLCSPLTGMPFCSQILKMNSEDMSTKYSVPMLSNTTVYIFTTSHIKTSTVKL